MERTNNHTFNEDSPSVHIHLQIIQNVIQRMAANSANCKVWCISIVSAILVIVADKELQKLGLLALLPIFVFLILDVYYLMLEIRFRESYSRFIQKLHGEKVVVEDLYEVAPASVSMNVFKKALKSFAIIPFYLMLGVLVILAVFLLL